MAFTTAFTPNVVHQSLRLWTYPNREPSYLEFRSVGGGIRVGCSMKTIRARLEVGLLEFDESRRDPPREVTIRVLTRSFRVRTWETYASPDAFSVSAARFELDVGELWVAANAFPEHICVRFGGQQHGAPEYDWRDYRKSHV